MADVFDAVLRRERDDAYLAITELVAIIVDELDADDPLPDPAAYTVSAAARLAVSSAMATAERDGQRPADRSATSVDELARQLIEEGLELEAAAREMAGPDFVNAHQGRAIGLRQAGLRLAALLAQPAKRDLVEAVS